MSTRVHEFDDREGGRFRVSLIYDAPTDTGKSAARTDSETGTRMSLDNLAKLVEGNADAGSD